MLLTLYVLGYVTRDLLYQTQDVWYVVVNASRYKKHGKGAKEDSG